MRSRLAGPVLAPILALASPAPPALGQGSFVHWETPHVHPLDRTPDGALLLAVNTPDARLEVFDVSGEVPLPLGAVPVGIDPVSVRARTDAEAWVVNHLSDSVSIVDLATMRVVRTLDTDDEPCDVVFAGSPQRAFVSCSQANTVLAFDLADLDAAPERVALEAEDPRALAVSPDGSTVYAAIFESGNGTTILGGGKKGNQVIDFPPNAVNKPEGPYGGVNPPPNAGDAFVPAQDPGNPAPPRVGLIVREDDGGRWVDDNGGDWTELVSGANADLSGRPVGWTLLDRDVAAISTADLSVTWIERLMNLDMALAVHPATGRLSVVGTDAMNHVRYEPNVKGRFLQVVIATVEPDGAERRVADLNPHLTYGKATVRQALRDRSLGDPRGIAWAPAGDYAIVTGMGSDNAVLVGPTGERLADSDPIELGEGPTGVVFDARRPRAYVLNKFESSISVVDLGARKESVRVAFYDPSPAAVRKGRRHLYGTHETSGLGHVACASCHVDARTDRLAWDLGDPAGEMKGLEGQNLGAGNPFVFEPFSPFHPMKGPMLTQTLQDIVGKEPLHWRGDRDGLEEFAPAFQGLQGDDETPTAEEMQEFEDFLATIHFPPNPHRELDNGLPDRLPLPGHWTTGRFLPSGQPLPDGDATRGLELYQPPSFLDQGFLSCQSCHTLPTGMGTDSTWSGSEYVPLDVGPLGEHHHALTSEDGSHQTSFKIPQLRALHERTGFTMTQTTSTAGFGYLHDGSVPSLERFLSEAAFIVQSDQDVADLVAFMLAFAGSDLPGGAPDQLHLPPGTESRDTHAGVGRQLTLASPPADGSAEDALLEDLLALGDAGAVGLIAKGRADGEPRGWVYLGSGAWQSDRASELTDTVALVAGAAAESERTLTAVPLGTQTRMGVDRDEDGWLDADELDAGSDPADPDSTPR